jgi:hypothetical protein
MFLSAMNFSRYCFAALLVADDKPTADVAPGGGRVCLGALIRTRKRHRRDKKYRNSERLHHGTGHKISDREICKAIGWMATRMKWIVAISRFNASPG